jgi:hypothetical protein
MISTFEELKPGILFGSPGRSLAVLSTTGWKPIKSIVTLPDNCFIAKWTFGRPWFLTEKLDFSIGLTSAFTHVERGYWDDKNYQTWKMLSDEDFFILLIHKEDFPFLYPLTEFDIPIVTTFK